MLNPPLSLLSDDLLASIVEQLAMLAFEIDLKNLSLADRAFTQPCQKYIFREIMLGGHSWIKLSRQLAKKKKFLNDKPSFANRVRVVDINITSKENTSIFKNPNFTSIFQLFAKSPMPPHELHLCGPTSWFTLLEDPMLVVRQLAESFFSQTLTILHISNCANAPLHLFLICPRLIEVLLDEVGATDNYPDNQCSGREAPLLEVLQYRNSHSLVEQMIAPPPRFNTPVVLWSNLRVLTIAPRDKEGVACLQPILDAACNTLEELYLTSISVDETQLTQDIPIAGLVNLRNLPNLRVFSFYTLINCITPPFAVLHDVNIVLGTIPECNRVTNLGFEFKIIGRHPFRGCLEQDWVGMFNEVIRIGGGKPLELELQMEVSYGFEVEYPGEDELYMCIVEKAASLSDYPKICTHFWNPTFYSRGINPIPRGRVRRRCRW